MRLHFAKGYTHSRRRGYVDDAAFGFKILVVVKDFDENARLDGKGRCEHKASYNWALNLCSRATGLSPLAGPRSVDREDDREERGARLVLGGLNLNRASQFARKLIAAAKVCHGNS